MYDEVESRRKDLYNLLGELPERERPVTAKTVSVAERSSYVVETLVLDLNGLEPVPAYFVRPKDLQGKAPAVLYNHAHGGNYVLGKDELLSGRQALQDPPYAEALTSEGWCALAIDAWNFGERRGKTESELFKEMLWQGRVLWGMMVYDSLKAVDYLMTREEVDGSRIATLGLSMGSTMAWWVAALDPRVKVCVDLCCLTDYEALLATRGLDHHGIYYYVPGLLKHFSTAAINALICPRPHLAVAGNYDPLTPPEGLDRVDAALQDVYGSAGCLEKWRLLRYNTGHFETAHARAEVLQFLRRWL